MVNILFAAVDCICFAALILLTCLNFKLENRVKELESKYVDYSQPIANAGAKLVEIENRVNELENGTVPDYEKAKEAKNALNTFNDSITSIFGFNPSLALHKENNEE